MSKNITIEVPDFTVIKIALEFKYEAEIEFKHAEDLKLSNYVDKYLTKTKDLIRRKQAKALKLHLAASKLLKI